MSRLDELPPDQRATLSLLLRQRKSYAEVALLLGIAERAVHDRAHGALAVLAPRQARELAPERREQIGEYLLGQAGVADRLRTRTELAGSEPARAWAQALLGELAPLGATLPELPAAAIAAPSSAEPSASTGPTPSAGAAPSPGGAPSAGAAASTGRPSSAAGARRAPVAAGASARPHTPAAPSATPAPSAKTGPPSSRLGGALLLAAIVIAVVVAVILLSGGGSSHSRTTASTSSSTTTGTGKALGTNIASLPLHSPSSTSHSVGVVEVLSEKGKQAYLLDAEKLPETHGFFYAVWLYNSPKSALPLSRAPAVGASRKLAGEAVLPSNAGEYHKILLTRETSSHPTHPGHVVLEGAFSLTATGTASAGS